MIDDVSPPGSWAKVIRSLPSAKPPSERSVQRDIIDYLHKAYRIRCIHVPNGAHFAGDRVARAKQMTALKRDGLMPGFPDLIAFSPAGGIGFLEVKRGEGRERAGQGDCHSWLRSLGHPVAVVRSIDDAVAALKSWEWVK